MITSDLGAGRQFAFEPAPLRGRQSQSPRQGSSSDEGCTVSEYSTSTVRRSDGKNKQARRMLPPGAGSDVSGSYLDGCSIAGANDALARASELHLRSPGIFAGLRFRAGNFNAAPLTKLLSAIINESGSIGYPGGQVDYEILTDDEPTVLPMDLHQNVMRNRVSHSWVDYCIAVKAFVVPERWLEAITRSAESAPPTNLSSTSSSSVRLPVTSANPPSSPDDCVRCARTLHIMNNEWDGKTIKALKSQMLYQHLPNVSDLLQRYRLYFAANSPRYAARIKTKPIAAGLTVKQASVASDLGVDSRASPGSVASPGGLAGKIDTWLSGDESHTISRSDKLLSHKFSPEAPLSGSGPAFPINSTLATSEGSPPLTYLSPVPSPSRSDASLSIVGETSHVITLAQLEATNSASPSVDLESSRSVADADDHGDARNESPPISAPGTSSQRHTSPRAATSTASRAPKYMHTYPPPRVLQDAKLWEAKDSGLSFACGRYLDWSRLRCLGNERVLGIELVAAYLRRVISSIEGAGRPRIGYIDPLYLSTGLNGFQGECGLGGILKPKDAMLLKAIQEDFLLIYDIILLPYRVSSQSPTGHDGRRWCAGAMFVAGKTMLIYDPFFESASSIMRSFNATVTTLITGVNAIRGRPVVPEDLQSWDVWYLKGGPKADNDEQAGVYACLFLARIAQHPFAPARGAFDFSCLSPRVARTTDRPPRPANEMTKGELEELEIAGRLDILDMLIP